MRAGGFPHNRRAASHPEAGARLLVVVPHVSMYGPHRRELWRFTPYGLHRLLATAFAPAAITMRAYGNSLTAAGELRGLVAQEFAATELDAHDPCFPVEVCA
jgi:hypothetical protein